MGSTASNISKVDVLKSSQEQTVIYSTSDSRTCTLRVSVGVDNASVTLRDYTFTSEGTIADIGVRDENRRDGGGSRTFYFYHGGNTPLVNKGADYMQIDYGIKHVRIGALYACIIDIDTPWPALFVAHMYGFPGDKLCLAIVEVWRNRDTCFMFNLRGPNWYSSTAHATQDMAMYYAHLPLVQFTRTTNTGLINNTGGPVNGHLNGSIINLFNFFVNYERMRS